MGLKMRGALRCGRCGKPRGITHTCINGRGRRRARMQSPVTWECSNCHKTRGLVHTCITKTDFRKRKRAAARKRATAERQVKRKAVRARQAARRKAAAAERRARAKARKKAATGRARTSRPRGDGHEPGTCGDRDCPKYGCKTYWLGMANCPLPHGGGD
jgi:hypothetical protein